MDGVLSNLKGNSCFVYLDIIVYSSIEQHAVRLREILERLRVSNLKAHPQKCQFVLDSIEYLGHIVSKDGVLPDPRKVQAIKNYPRPKSGREV
jgi:hypothetical protein